MSSRWRVVVLTGAGISTDSGIPDFRGPNGLWTKNPAAEKASDIRFYLGDPEVVNDGPVGLARFSTLRSWLSQWSYDYARCDAITSGARISVPVLVLGNSAGSVAGGNWW